MRKLSTQILDTLTKIEGSGSFQAQGSKDFCAPGLSIHRLGEITFPITAQTAKSIIGKAHKAPFGKGSKTVTDPKVRSAWELDATLLRFDNPRWPKFMADLLKEVQKGLGLENHKIDAHLYKMLVYEPGDFFLSHKDSEKEAGMFGTLIVGLPCVHSGGTLHIRFDGKEVVSDFSTANMFEMPFAAFYADCEHEIKPLLSGHRVVLVYNLVQTEAKAPKIAISQFKNHVEALTDLLQKATEKETEQPLAILLDHQYTPANFSRNALKLNDRPRADAILEAAEKAGFFAILGLVTHYLQGDMEYSGRYRRKSRYWGDYDDFDAEDGEMGEIFEEEKQVLHWCEDDIPGLGEWDLEDEQIITNQTLGEGEPLEKDADGYTGNAGMTIEYWYHYGAVILWPKRVLVDILNEASAEVRSAWLHYLTENWDKPGLSAPDTAPKVALNLSEHLENYQGSRYSDTDFSPLAKSLARLAGKEGLAKKCVKGLVSVFEKISTEAWLLLLSHLNHGVQDLIFEQTAARKNNGTTQHLALVLLEIGLSESDEKSPLSTCFDTQFERLPGYIAQLTLVEDEPHENKWRTWHKTEFYENVSKLLEHLIVLSTLPEAKGVWAEKATAAITQKINRTFVHEVLTKLINPATEQTPLVLLLKQASRTFLEKSAAQKPQPQADWGREVPKSGYYQKSLDQLRPFLENPTLQKIEIRAAQAIRSELENAVRNCNLDLDMETNKKGSPHGLVLTKITYFYDRALKKWKEDVALLEQI